MIPGTVPHKNDPFRKQKQDFLEKKRSNAECARQSAANENQKAETNMTRREMFAAILPTFGEKLVNGLREIESQKRNISNRP